MGKQNYSIGDKYGRLTITNIFQRPIGKKGRKQWAVKCKCNCGGETITTITKLREKDTKSCGCLHKEKMSKHKMSNSKEYECWRRMFERTNNKNNKRWKDYGGRGIKVCNRWKKFENFYQDMGKKPLNVSLERIDNNKGYKPSNCKWATRLEQQNNMRRNVIIEYNGEKRTIAEWARKLNMKYCTFNTRIRRGWSIVNAINFPVGNGKRKNIAL